MLMPCQRGRPATLWHHLLIMRQDQRNALATKQTMQLPANKGPWQRAEWVLWNQAACAHSVSRERSVWMDLFVYWCLCFVFVSQQWPCLACLQTCSYTRCDKPAGKPMPSRLRVRAAERARLSQGSWGTWTSSEMLTKSGDFSGYKCTKYIKSALLKCQFLFPVQDGNTIVFNLKNLDHCVCWD